LQKEITDECPAFGGHDDPWLQVITKRSWFDEAML
jgi:hypothetical protein